MIYILYIILLFIIELAYFKIANNYNIIDKPNHRSSHTEVTIRGGGVIFTLAILMWFAFSGFQYPFFICGLVLVSFISFIDDIKDFSKRLRLACQFIAIVLVFYQLGIFSWNWMWIVPAFVFFIGVINAYNFMDGINGITGTYSLVLLASLLWIDQYYVAFVDPQLLLIAIIGILVFNFFNFRKKAVCFAGDVGSISMAFVICFLLLKLMLKTNDIKYLLLLSVYGIDTAFTIIIRLSRHENIFQAHRSHLYQLLVNERGQQHLLIAFFYGVTQLIVNLIVIRSQIDSPLMLIVILIPLSLIYLVIRFLINNNKIIETRFF